MTVSELKRLHDYGVPLDQYADATYARLRAGELEIGHGFSDKARLASRQELNDLFGKMNGLDHVATGTK